MLPPTTISQPVLFEIPGSATGMAELFPAAWAAMEKLISPDVNTRNSALDQLLALEAHRLSPLIAYTLAIHLEDRDIEFRSRIAQALGSLLSSRDDGEQVPEFVRQGLKSYLSQMRRRKVYAILQVAAFRADTESSVAALLNACSFAGASLAIIFLDRKLSLDIRRQAIIFAGRVGFLDTIPSLERLRDRLESRTNGQRKMVFAPPDSEDEKSLLPAVQTALAYLNSP